MNRTRRFRKACRRDGRCIHCGKALKPEFADQQRRDCPACKESIFGRCRKHSKIERRVQRARCRECRKAKAKGERR